VRNRGIVRGRLFFGYLILFAAVIGWFTAMWLSPYDTNTAAEGTEHVRGTVVTVLRNGAIGTLLLSALAGWLLFPARRPENKRRDWLIGGLIALLVLSSLYELIWLRAAIQG
jgi:hypothetical protein